MPPDFLNRDQAINNQRPDPFPGRAAGAAAGGTQGVSWRDFGRGVPRLETGGHLQARTLPSWRIARRSPARCEVGSLTEELERELPDVAAAVTPLGSANYPSRPNARKQRPHGRCYGSALANVKDEPRRELARLVQRRAFQNRRPWLEHEP